MLTIYDYIKIKLEEMKNDITNVLISQKKYISIHAEENGNLTNNKIEYFFGNGLDNNNEYGYPMPCDGQIIAWSICSVSGSNVAAEVKTNIR